MPSRRKFRKKTFSQLPLETVEVELTDIAAGGKAIGKASDGRVMFVSYAMPGERVVAEVTETSSQYLEARVVRVLRPSPFRIEPRCQYFGQCGGCQLQHVEYDEQLRLKTKIVQDQLIRVGRFSLDEFSGVNFTIGMDIPWNYRNHMRFTVWRNGAVGLMRQGTRRLLPIDQCEIACDQINETLKQVQGTTTGTQQLAARVGVNTGDILIHPRLRWRNAAMDSTLVSGQKFVTESLLGYRYQVSAAAFFQVNTSQAERLIMYVLAKVKELNARIVIDAYAGVGVFASHLSEHVEQVFAIEESPSAAIDALVNLANLSGVHWVTARVEEVLPDHDPSPDVVIIDPPRRGIHRVVIDALISSSTRRIIYVSCDPATFSRDLRLLVDGGFRLIEVQPVDMFPHTQHIECVAVLDRLSVI